MGLDTMSAAERSIVTTATVSELRSGEAVAPGQFRDPLDGASREHSVAVVGMGYVGLATALAFAANGRPVIGIDTSPERRAAIMKRRVDLSPTEHDRLGHALDSSLITIVGKPDLLGVADTVVICAPTPLDEHRVPDLRALRIACASVVERVRPGQLLVLTSTSYVGTTRDLIVRPLSERGLIPGRDVHIAFSPERINPGSTDFPSNQVPRVVGGVTPACTRRAAESLREICSAVHEVASPEAAEMTKLVENAFRAVNIAFVNEVADVCTALNLNVREIIDAAATKPFGFMSFLPGPGVGGHCIPCDPHYLLWQLRAERVQTPVMESAMAAIARRPHRVVERLVELLSERGEGLGGSRVVVIGVTYKSGVDDVRESPALEIIQELLRRGALVSYVDPRVPELQLRDGTTLTSAPMQSVQDAAAVLLHTLHDGIDVSSFAGARLLLDATYRLTEAPDRLLP